MVDMHGMKLQWLFLGCFQLGAKMEQDMGIHAAAVGYPVARGGVAEEDMLQR